MRNGADQEQYAIRQRGVVHGELCRPVLGCQYGGGEASVADEAIGGTVGNDTTAVRTLSGGVRYVNRGGYDRGTVQGFKGSSEVLAGKKWRNLAALGWTRQAHATQSHKGHHVKAQASRSQAIGVMRFIEFFKFTRIHPLDVKSS